MKLKSYKFRIYPNETQKILLGKTFGCTRFFWNYMKEIFNTQEKKFKTSTQMRKEFDFLQEVSAGALQQKEMDFKEFKKQFFSKSRKVKIGRPKFKSRRDKQAYRLPNQKFKIVGNKIQLEKIGKVKIVLDREFPEIHRFISVTVSMTTSKEYYVYIVVEQEIESLKKTNKEVGIDVGVKTFIVQSDGIEVANPKYFSKNQAKLAKLQQYYSLKKKGSNRQVKTRLKIAKLHRDIVRQRQHFIHNESIRLIRDYDRIFIEDLDVKGMLESKLMSKEISDVSWSEFTRQLLYKADWYGKTVHKIDRYYASSKTCECGVKNNELKLSDREWVCKSCGVINDRDALASRNILKEGRRSLDDVTDT